MDTKFADYMLTTVPAPGSNWCYNFKYTIPDGDFITINPQCTPMATMTGKKFVIGNSSGVGSQEYDTYEAAEQAAAEAATKNRQAYTIYDAIAIVAPKTDTITTPLKKGPAAIEG